MLIFIEKRQFRIFWIKIVQMGNFHSKTGKLIIIIELSIFKAVYVPDFILKGEFSFFAQNKGIFSSE